jgi:hypothetical protein
MCHATSHRYTCGCIKLKELKFCHWIEDAEDLLADGDMDTQNLTKFVATLMCKVLHGKLSEHFDIEVPYDRQEFIHAEVQDLRAGCVRDSVEAFGERDMPCARCLANAVMVARGDAEYAENET